MPNVTTNPSVPQPPTQARVTIAQPADAGAPSAGAGVGPQAAAANPTNAAPQQQEILPQYYAAEIFEREPQQQEILPQYDAFEIAERARADAAEQEMHHFNRTKQLPQVSELDALDTENEPDIDGNNSDFADDDSEDGHPPQTHAVEQKHEVPTNATPLVIDVSTEPFAAIVDPTCPLTGHVTHRLLPNNGSVVDIGILPPSIHRKDNVTYLLTLDNGLRVWNLDTLECVRNFELALHTVPVHLNITPNGQVGVMFKDRAGSTYDIFTGKVTDNYDSYGHCSHFLGDGTYAVASAHYGASGPIVKVFYPGASYQAAELKGHSKEVTAMVSLADNRTLITASKDRTIKVWDVVTSGWLQTFSGHQQVVTSVIVLDQNTIASGSGDCTIRIWDLRSGSCVRVLEGHKGWVWRLCLFGPNHIISAAFDATLKIWEIESGKCVGTLPNYRAPRCLKALPNGALAVGNWEGFINIVR